MGTNVLSNAKHFHCSCHATWLPCKTSYCGILNIDSAKTGSEFATSSDLKTSGLVHSESTRFRILCVFKTLHSGERIQKVRDSHAGFAGYVWTEGKSARKKVRIKNSPVYV